MTTPVSGPERCKNDLQHELALLCDRGRPEEERRRAAERIADSANPAAVVPLAVLMTEVEVKLLETIRSALEALGAVAMLTRGLSDPSPETRVQSARLLGYLADPRALDPLLAALEDADPRVREQAADALIPLCAPAATGALEAHLSEDVEPNVRAAAAQALGEIADDRAHAALGRALTRETDGFARVIVELAWARAQRIRDERAFWS